MSLFNVKKTVAERRDLFGVHNPFENPTVPLSSVGLDEIFGQVSRSDSGQNVTHDNAMAIPTFWRCVKLMSELIASCPMRAYKNPGKQEQFPDLLDPSNPAMMYTQFELWRLTVAHMCTWGNAFVYKVRQKTNAEGKTLPKNHPLRGNIVD